MHKITFGEITVELKRHTYLPHCDHLQLEMDDDAQLMRCKDCGIFISAFKFLRENLGQHYFFHQQITKMEQEIKLKYRILKGLKTKERNAKARIRNAEKAIGKD